MTQTPKIFKWHVQFPENEVVTGVSRPSFVAVCRGNDRIASLLNYFAYEASMRIEVTHEDCKVVVLTRTLDEILKRLNYNVSKKTLIGYLDKLNTWGYVASERYQRDYKVNLEKIQEAINNPPKLEPKPTYDRHPTKGCRTTTLQPFESELEEKVVKLQLNVVELQQKVVELQQKVEVLLTLQPAMNTSFEAASDSKIESLRERESNRDITRESNTSANASANEYIPTEKSSKPFQSLTGGKKPTKPQNPKQTALPLEKTSIFLTAEEHRIYDYWTKLHSGFQDKITDSVKERCGQLAPVIKSYEDMNGLYEYTRNQPYLNGKGVRLGNLVSSYTAWCSSLPVKTDSGANNGTATAKPERSHNLVSELQSAKNNSRLFHAAAKKQRERGQIEEAIETERYAAEADADIARLSQQEQQIA